VTRLQLTMRPLEPAQDAALIHGWVTQERATFWMMSDHSLEEVREIYEWIDAQDTHAAYLVRLDDRPVALFQTYDPRAEEIGQHYDVQDGDIGWHLMMGPVESPVPGLTHAVIDLMGDFVFGDPSIKRMVAEPDARNDKMQRLVDSRAMDRAGVVELEKKPATLVFYTREQFETDRARRS
jgi:RimJ/RimL family protein N-acetyltransferase